MEVNNPNSFSNKLTSWQEIHKQVSISKVLYSQAGAHDKICRFSLKKYPCSAKTGVLVLKQVRRNMLTKKNVMKTFLTWNQPWIVTCCGWICLMARLLGQTVRSTWCCVETDQYNCEIQPKIAVIQLQRHINNK